ncbi:TIGR04283 family arsenosugar biosynthesis glycosyltransferase [Roseovarius sp. MMSF_3281]|uniref:TIGR04283 family arsenosugar biosynthesis glycosyltransferase n=1 Tax=Roseovarius sp. MMSF_3281 TaxID=3046694 RepID=UPI00273FCA7D|nr:TIGR04283 family arsenosugar biosynthesis glycosyltransferase [Roseovarius sp. MMSF_3281]
MRAKLSIVIPTLNAADTLPLCLGALGEGLEAGMIREVVFSDGGSQDQTLEIADAAGAVVVRGAPSRGGQLRRGVAVTQGEWVLVLHADSVLPSGWPAVVATQMQVESPAAFRLRFDARGLAPRLVAGWANLRSRVFHLPYGDQGLLISRQDYEAVGGYPDIPLMEDVTIARRLRRRLMLLPVAITTSAAKYKRDGWLRRGARNLSILLRYLLGADPAQLAKRY